jgi:hypothetical protein
MDQGAEEDMEEVEAEVEVEEEEEEEMEALPTFRALL